MNLELLILGGYGQFVWPAFVFTFVLQGQTSLNSDNQKVNHLTAGDSFIVPKGDTYILSKHSDNLELLEISCPENF